VKERLTGAIILVALIVLLVPELLTGPIRPKSAPAASSTGAFLRVPTAGRSTPAEPPLRSYTLTLSGEPVAPATPAAQTQAATGSTDGTGASEGSQEAPAQAASNASSPRTPEQSAGAGSGGLQLPKTPPRQAVREAESEASAGGWIVQLGSFASRGNADRLARSLEGRGFHMSVSPARAGSRVLWRVRAGPAHDRAGAQRLAARLRALGHHGELLPIR
jgi:DedD protein